MDIAFYTISIFNQSILFHQPIFCSPSLSHHDSYEFTGLGNFSSLHNSYIKRALLPLFSRVGLEMEMIVIVEQDVFSFGMWMYELLSRPGITVPSISAENGPCAAS